MAAPVSFSRLILFMASRGMGRCLSQGKTGSRTCLGPTWDFQAGRTCQPRCGLRRRTHAQRRTMTMRFYTCAHRFYCGVDLHARTTYLCILERAGQVGIRRCHRKRRFQSAKSVKSADCVSWARRSRRRSACSGQPSSLITCLAPPRAETSDGTSPLQQTRKSQQRSASYARKKRDLLNFDVPLLTRETINGLAAALCSDRLRR